MARVFIAQEAAGRPAAPSIPGDPAQEALQLLETLYPRAAKLGRNRSVIEILLLQALAHQAAGDLTQAMTSLTQALSLAEPEGFVRLFLDEGPPVEKLLSRIHASHEGEGLKQYIQKLLTGFPPSPPTTITIAPTPTHESKIPPPPPQIQNLVEPLSSRELEVLHFIATGKSNKEIAQTLVIAPGTVKKHIHNIYGKLGVHSRTQALARANALDLLP